MKRKVFVFAVVFIVALGAFAQPAARRTTEQQSTSSANKTKSVREFPTAVEMPDDAAWRRDIYRALDLTKDANATLYYPTKATGDRMSLFNYVFNLVLRGQVKAYEYSQSGVEDYDEKRQIRAKKLMDQFEIYYETTDDGKIKLSSIDLPTEQVKYWYIKESAYYDQHTATFRAKVSALCPVLVRGDYEFGGAETRNPMFWVNYEDVAPYLSKLMLMGSNLNNAASLSADDYFTLNRYEGEIYRTTNLQDRILAEYCPTDSAMTKEQKRIEKELTDFQKHVWGHDSIPEDTVAVDSAAVDTKKASSPTRRTSASTSTRRTTVSSSTTTKKTAAATEKRQRSTSQPKQKVAKTPRSTGGTISVRKERH